MPSISDLEMFVKVAETSNMSAAGRELGLSPAVVSKHISALENKLKARLFERTTRQLYLTEKGEHYYQHVVNALKELQKAEKSVHLQDGEPQGTLKITVPTIFGRKHLSPIISEFLKRYKKMDIDFNLSDEFTDILSGKYDIAIRIGQVKSDGLITHVLASNDRILCASPGYLKKHGTPTKLSDLKKHNCIALNSQSSWILNGPNGQEAIQISGNLQTNSSDFIHEFVLAGEGIALRSKWEIAKNLENGTLTTFLPEYVGLSDVKIHLVYPNREVIPVKVEAFVKFTLKKFNMLMNIKPEKILATN